MTFQVRNILSSNPLKQYKSLSLSIFVLAIVFPAGNAWTYENYNTSFEKSVSREALHIKPTLASVVTDSCKHLLKANNDASANQNTNLNQRNAGKIAAIGIILGARFATEPKGNMKKMDSSAQAVAKFRKCHKENTLSIMASAY